MKISDEKIESLIAAHEYCDSQDKSTAFLIEFLQDVAGVDFDTAMYYLLNSERILTEREKKPKFSMADFEKIPANGIIRKGMTTNSPQGLYMTDGGGLLKWVAKKGMANDWAMYCEYMDKDYDYVLKHGQKVYDKNNIMNVFPVEEDVFKLYRY